MNNSDFTIGCKSCFLYLREVLAVSWCGCEGRGILAESSSRIQESAQEAWFTHDGLHDFAIFHWQFPSVTPAGCGPRESILQRVKLIRDCNFLDSCVYKFELSIVRSAYSAITDDPSKNFNVCFC